MVLNLHQIDILTTTGAIQIPEILFSPIKVLNVTYLHTLMSMINYAYQAHCG